ncbi:excisionase [Oleiphilus messinensis]|uniref:Excisionase n=1 Tax=Oleiphilus messinensis TaxID=141451 RepID=A0A1Y0ICB7_9GAMM|nr:helix-turn-helix domain-containing protein [Oleiphilus messinensis]ARU58202.1 excisionase [Oleiphilus messinensis]
MTDEILTIKEVASYLKVNDRTVYRLASSQKIPAFKVGNAWRFKRKDLEEWINNQQNSASAEGGASDADHR